MPQKPINTPMKQIDDNYILDRIREIWSKLSKDKRRFLDVLLQSAAKKVLGETIAKEYLPIRDSEQAEASTAQLPQAEASIAQLPQIHIILVAVSLMPESRLVAGSINPHLTIVPYLAEALGSIVEQDTAALLEYSKAYGELGDSSGEVGIEDAGAYAEAYSLWIEKTALYLQECRSTVRAVSFNEFTHLWDKSSGLDYLATHYLLRKKRGCDSRRVFIYDKTYWEDSMLLRRLFAEVYVQLEAGVNARVCSMEQLEQIGKGYYYPLLSFGTYDRFAMGVLIPHNTNPVVKLIHDENQIRDAIIILDDIFDHAEPGLRWAKKHQTQMDPVVGDFINTRIVALRETIKSRHLD